MWLWAEALPTHVHAERAQLVAALPPGAAAGAPRNCAPLAEGMRLRVLCEDAGAPPELYSECSWVFESTCVSYARGLTLAQNVGLADGGTWALTYAWSRDPQQRWAEKSKM